MRGFPYILAVVFLKNYTGYAQKRSRMDQNTTVPAGVQPLGAHCLHSPFRCHAEQQPMAPQMILTLRAHSRLVAAETRFHTSPKLMVPQKDAG